MQQQIIKLQQFHNNSQEAQLYAETCAAKWDYYGNMKYQTFQYINTLVDHVFDTFYDDAFDDLNTSPASLDFAGLNAFFNHNIIDVIGLLKKSSCFESALLEADLLSGLQYGDAGENERKFIIEISEAVNSSVWHKKICEAYNKAP